jgi:hypothetical protein
VKKHLRRWGAAYVLLALFLGSWIGQFFTQLAEFRQEEAAHGQPFEWREFLSVFFSATFENWQSEWLQLLVQAVLLLAMKHMIFRADAEDMERLQSKVDALLRAQEIDVERIEAEVERQQAE